MLFEVFILWYDCIFWIVDQHKHVGLDSAPEKIKETGSFLFDCYGADYRVVRDVPGISLACVSNCAESD